MPSLLPESSKIYIRSLITAFGLSINQVMPGTALSTSADTTPSTQECFVPRVTCLSPYQRFS